MRPPFIRVHVSLDAEDRLSRATDDLKRVTEHIEQEKAINKEVQRRQVTLRIDERMLNVISRMRSRTVFSDLALSMENVQTSIDRAINIVRSKTGTLRQRQS